eukprot:Pgem_evm1s10318
MVVDGLVNEAISLAVCVVVGFILGCILCDFAEYWNWPTNEMASRGNWQALAVGVGVALPSGAGVALSILGNNAASLV